MGNKQIGLVSLHYKHNYGTMLQAFALQRKLYLMGYETQYIDYRHPMPKLPARRYFMHRIKRLPANLVDLPKIIKKMYFASEMALRHQLFDDFCNKHIVMSRTRYFSQAELIRSKPDYDLSIVGSDQVWNPNLSFYSGVYFLDFINDPQKIKAAYAPSIGVSNLTSQQASELAEYLKPFTYLSCREKIGADILSDICKRPVLKVVDPTFLLNKNEWLKMAVDPEIEEPYIICYFLGDMKWHREFVEKLESQTSIKAYYIPVSHLDIGKKNALYKIGPAEFLGLIKNAAYVCTDSFHGSIFSVIFKKQLYGFCKRSDKERASDNSRLVDLFDSLGISFRLVRTLPGTSVNVSDIDYSMVQSRLGPEIQKSEVYLKEILQRI